jgi:predicted ATPase
MAELARLLPELARAHPEWRVAPLTQEWQRQRLFEAIARALLARAQPLLLFLDDLQWCDRDTVACLR